jgi:hypothetical protein
MKKSALAIVFILLAASTVGQKPDLSSLTPGARQQYDTYITKSKRTKNAGFILLGSGAALTILGPVVGLQGVIDEVGNDNGDTKLSAGIIMFYTGIAAVVVSIPCFIVAGSQKRKASLLLQGQQVSFNLQRSGQLNYVSAGIALSL